MRNATRRQAGRPRTRRAALLALVAAWALLVSPLLGRVARADTANEEIEAGIAFYNDLEYEQAVATLERALARPNLTKAELTEGYKMLALSYVALDQSDKAKEAFSKLLDVDPGYTLPRTENPRAVDLFEEVRAARPVATAVTISAAASPSSPRPGATVSFTISVGDQDGQVKNVNLHYRIRGQRSWSAVAAERSERGWSASLSGAFVTGPAIEYWLAATDAAGTVLAYEGSEGQPLVLLVEGGKGGKPIYAAWWFWTGVGGAVVLGAAAVLLLGGSGDSNEDATVTITVN